MKITLQGRPDKKCGKFKTLSSNSIHCCDPKFDVLASATPRRWQNPHFSPWVSWRCLVFVKQGYPAAPAAAGVPFVEDKAASKMEQERTSCILKHRDVDARSIILYEAPDSQSQQCLLASL